MRNSEKVRKDAKLQKKQPKKDKQHGYDVGEEQRSTLAGKKPHPPLRRSKSTGRRNSQAARQAEVPADEKIRSLEGLFSEYLS